MPRTNWQWRPLKRGFATELAKVRTTLPKSTPIEIWFQDEACVGQKNKITRRWAGRGTRPSAPKDQRTKSVYIFGAICPALGQGAGLVLSFCNQYQRGGPAPGGNLPHGRSGAHAVTLSTRALKAQGCGFLFLPPSSPDPNPIEQAFSKLKSHLRRIGARTYDGLIAALCGLFDPAECWTFLKAAGYALD